MKSLIFSTLTPLPAFAPQIGVIQQHARLFYDEHRDRAKGGFLRIARGKGDVQTFSVWGQSGHACRSIAAILDPSGFGIIEDVLDFFKRQPSTIQNLQESVSELEHAARLTWLLGLCLAFLGLPVLLSLGDILVRICDGVGKRLGHLSDFLLAQV